MFELSNYLVGIYKVDDCTDSITLVNHPPPPLPLPSQPQRLDFTQSNGGGDNTLVMQQETQGEPSEPQPPPTQQRMSAEMSRLCGRETTFAPRLESTVLSQVVAAAATSESNEPRSPTAMNVA